MGQIEAQAPTNVYCAFFTGDPIPDDLTYQITGSTASLGLQIIGKSRMQKTNRLVAATDMDLTKLDVKMSNRSAEKQAILAVRGVPTKAAIESSKARVKQIKMHVMKKN